LPTDQLVALAAHHLDEDGELQLAAAGHAEGVGAVGGLDADGDVGQQLAPEPLAELARGDVLPSRPAIGEVLTEKIMAIVGSSIWIAGSGRGPLAIADRLADGDLLEAGDGDDVAGTGLGDLDALQPLVAVEHRDTLPVFCEPSSRQSGVARLRSVPLKTRPIASRPT
jgi:hypothetical protein